MLQKNNCDKIICLGDLIDLSDECGCVELVQKNCDVSVIGNHDICAIKRIPEFAGMFKYPDNRYQLSVEEQIKIANNRIRMIESGEDINKICISDNTKNFLDSLPERTIFKADGMNILLSHRVYPNFSGCGKNSRGTTNKKGYLGLFSTFRFYEK